MVTDGTFDKKEYNGFNLMFFYITKKKKLVNDIHGNNDTFLK